MPETCTQEHTTHMLAMAARAQARVQERLRRGALMKKAPPLPFYKNNATAASTRHIKPKTRPGAAEGVITGHVVR